MAQAITSTWHVSWGFQEYHFKGPHNKDYSILGSILGSPYLGKLPAVAWFLASCLQFLNLGRCMFCPFQARQRAPETFAAFMALTAVARKPSLTDPCDVCFSN